MSRAIFTLLCLILVAAPGCIDTRPITRRDAGPPVLPGADAGDVPGPRDSGPGIILMDSGRPGFPDAGPVFPRDSGPRPGTSCGTLTNVFGFLPGACMPRCSSSTASAIGSCSDGTCVQSTLDGDFTAEAQFTFMGMTYPLDCRACYNQQLVACYYQSCPSQTMAWAACDPDTEDCTSQTDTLQTCLDASSSLDSCASTNLALCFP